ncbi:MAG: hypothetical protein ACI9V8_001631 [Urechidicola sp.]|jgi:hypothetical protein
MRRFKLKQYFLYASNLSLDHPNDPESYFVRIHP